MSNQINDYRLELNTRIQKSLYLINSLLLEAKRNDLIVDISIKPALIGKDGFPNCKHFQEVEINLFVEI